MNFRDVNIFDLNYEYCSENLGLLNLPPENNPRKGIVFRILSLFKGILRYGIFRKASKHKIEKNSILFFVMANNEYNSIKPISEELPNSFVFGKDQFKNGYPLGKIYLFSLIFIPIVFWKFLFCRKAYHKRSFSYAFDGFCLAYSSAYVLKKYLLRLQPKNIIISNQLGCFHRSLAFIAKELNIETIYMQHASVTEGYDNLNMFSTILLEGEDSLNKYQNNGTKNKKIFLVGMPKSDRSFLNIKKFTGINTIGICTNGMDDILLFSKLISSLKEKYPNLKINVRPHPADRRKEDWLNIATKYDCGFSDVSTIESFDFLRNMDLIISGDSNIHLESALLNIPSIYFDPHSLNLDWYDFVKNASDISSAHDFILTISFSGQNVRSKAKYYVESVNSIFDGNSKELATKIIQGDKIEKFFNIFTDNYSNIIFRIK
mgnify:FL=1